MRVHAQCPLSHQQVLHPSLTGRGEPPQVSSVPAEPAAPAVPALPPGVEAPSPPQLPNPRAIRSVHACTLDMLRGCLELAALASELDIPGPAARPASFALNQVLPPSRRADGRARDAVGAPGGDLTVGARFAVGAGAATARVHTGRADGGATRLRYQAAVSTGLSGAVGVLPAVAVDAGGLRVAMGAGRHAEPHGLCRAVRRGGALRRRAGLVGHDHHPAAVGRHRPLYASFTRSGAVTAAAAVGLRRGVGITRRLLYQSGRAHAEATRHQLLACLVVLAAQGAAGSAACSASDPRASPLPAARGAAARGAASGLPRLSRSPRASTS